jgi:hypothetical protein
VIFVLGGIGGYDPLPVSASLFLPVGGARHAVRGFYWHHGFGQPLKDLQDLRHLMRKGDELAELILAEKRAHPERPVYLLANSGGTAVALFAAEQLPAATLERVVLLAAAVSPHYDLRGALAATRGGIVSHYSPLDRLVLHWGTSHFGTADRHYVASAGCTGFAVPPDLCPEDRALYERLVQVSWHPRMILNGHGGGHTGIHAPHFLIHEVAPWFRD